MLAPFCGKRNILPPGIASLRIDAASLRRAQNACKRKDAGNESEIEGKSIIEEDAESSEGGAYEQRGEGEPTHDRERAKSRRSIAR